MHKLIWVILAVLIAQFSYGDKPLKWKWKRLSSEYGEIDLPTEKGKVQSCAEAFDIDNDGRAEVFISESEATPAIVMYKLSTLYTWEQHVIEKRKLSFSEGSASYDMDNDGDLDLILADKDENGQIWWWENPSPKLNKRRPWKRNYIIKDGEPGLNDFAFGDFNGDGKVDIAFWNYKTKTLNLGVYHKDISDEWTYKAIYQYNDDSQMQSNGMNSGNALVNYHEGIAVADINLDGIDDIVGGGSYFSFNGETFNQNVIDMGYTNSRVAVGQIIPGNRPEVVMSGSDSNGPLYLYEYSQGTWVKTKIDQVRNGHSLQITDFNGDGNLDVFSAEMIQKNESGPKMRIFMGDGSGKFSPLTISTTYSNHQSRLVDLDGDKDLDIVSKPMYWDVPRLEFWINEGEK